VFEEEVKKGERTALTTDELAVTVEEQEGDQESKKVDGKQMKKLIGRRMGVKQAKVVRQQERVDPVTGKGRSKGYGFIEMNTHADALRVLRWANNNANVGPLFEGWWTEELKDLIKQENGKETKDDVRLKRLKEELEKGTSGAKRSRGSLIVEFSIENVQVVQRRNATQRRAPVCFIFKDCSFFSKIHFHMLQLQSEDKRSKIQPAVKQTGEREAKKRRISEDKPKPGSAEVEPDKLGNKVGSLIGWKRKMRKAGNKSRSS
jgi:nucleolar protein 4